MATYTMKEAKPAPTANKGIIFWLKENLFPDFKSSLFTLFGLYVIYSIVEVVNSGARWIFIIEKFDQFMYGFYPESLHWRPNLVAIISIVFVFSFKYIKNLKVKIAGILLFPFVCFILISGGWFGLEVVETEKWGGLMLTILVAAVGIIASFPIGVVLALGRQSNMPILRTLCIGFIEFVRGVPLITILFMASVLLPLFFHDGIEFNKLLRALIGITLFQAAYIAEVVRGGLQAIPKGQYEASEALGLSYWQGMILIILPQALKISIPNLVGSFISLFKDTTLVLIIGLFDILAMVTLTNSDTNWLGYEVEGYVFVTLIYWVCCFSMSQYSKSIERKFNTEH